MSKKSYPPRSSALFNPQTQCPRPVFGIDVDGTLGEYHDHFLKFARGWLGKQMPPHLYDGSVPLYKWMGVSKDTYRKVKLAYRRGGMKRSMPCYSGASDLTRSLRKRGAVVVICTTRPFLQLDNVEPDTMEWLRRNRIQFDNVISGEWKYRDLATMYSADRIVCVLDDLPEMVEQAGGLGLPALLRRQPHNASSSLLVANDLETASAALHSALDDWESNHR